MKQDTNKILLEFLEARPAIKVGEIAKHLGISKPFITRIKDGKQPMPDKYIEPLHEFMEKYGWTSKNY